MAYSGCKSSFQGLRKALLLIELYKVLISPFIADIIITRQFGGTGDNMSMVTPDPDRMALINNAIGTQFEI